MREWILPTWFENQNNPLKATYSVGEMKFYNQTCRNWTVLGEGKPGNLILIDRWGVIHLPKRGISIEIWFHNGDCLYTPADFPSIAQKNCQDTPGVETQVDFEKGLIKTAIFPLATKTNRFTGLEINFTSRFEDTLKPIAVFLVIRPYDNEGFSGIKRLECKNKVLTADGSSIIIFEKDPKHCFFSNLDQGDVTGYFQTWTDNTRVVSSTGLCTGLVGYSGLPAELTKLKLFITPQRKRFQKKLKFDARLNWPGETKCLFEENIEDEKLIHTGTRLDELIGVCLSYFEIFNPKTTSPVDQYGILALNRFSHTQKSRIYLKTCLKNLLWQGLFTKGLFSENQILFTVADYCKISGDFKFAETYWPILKQIGYRVGFRRETAIRQENDKLNQVSYKPGGTYELNFWACASLKALVNLGQEINRDSEVQIFEEQYFSLWYKLLNSLADAAKGRERKIIPLDVHGGLGGGIVRNLSASYPLQLWEKGETHIRDSISLTLDQYIYQGGVFSPLDFQGVDLELTARLGQVLVREEIECDQILHFILEAASPTWTWPDRINPLSKKGIGQTGHDPNVMYQVLLFLRSLLVMEEERNLYLLPGVFHNRFWEPLQLKLNRMPTYFGEINLNCQTIGNVIQIDYQPFYRTRPQKICFNINKNYKLLYTDSDVSYHNSLLEISPDFQILRLKRVKSERLS
jgi:hypothetical protein